MWVWNEKSDDHWHDGYETKEETINEAMKMAEAYGFNEFYVGECCDMIHFEPKVEDILWKLGERFHDDSGCDYYIYDGVGEGHIKWLENKLKEIFDEFHKRAGIDLSWCKVINVELINVS